VLNLFTLPYAVNLFANRSKAKAITIAYQDNDDAYNAVVQMLFGGTPARGKLPVDADELYRAGLTLKTEPSGRLRYLPYEDPLANDPVFEKIDSLVEAGIVKKAYPGCQLLIAHKGNVILRKNYGFSDYTRIQPVTDSSLYDLASVTKVAATTLAVMKLYDDDKVNLDEPLSVTLPWLKNTNKDKITLRQVMTHQAGLVAWIPFYKETLANGKPDTAFYSESYSPDFALEVAKNLYLRTDYKNKLIQSIVESPVQSPGQYKYSDLGFILTQLYIEQKTGMPLDDYVVDIFYKPLGLPGLTFKPLQKINKKRIMPTENDTVFRHQLIHGYVHDQAAAMMGGVAGHAGLFGNSNDMAVLLQMLLQNGFYGGTQYLKPETVKLFTSRQFKNSRRGLGFDKPQLNPSEAGPASEEVPGESYGHTGFTGTYIWADPINDLSIVFLSNRVNPDAEPNKLVQLGTRTSIQEYLYKALAKSQGKSQPVLRKPVNSTY
jgi:CubicO group peptidase (beta-lactamase class C family)